MGKLRTISWRAHVLDFGNFHYMSEANSRATIRPDRDGGPRIGAQIGCQSEAALSALSRHPRQSFKQGIFRDIGLGILASRAFGADLTQQNHSPVDKP